MRKIEKLEKQIYEEYCDAEKYITCALLNKEEDQKLADTYAKLAQEELDHAAILHDAVRRLIEDYKAKNGEPPEAMMVVYKILHERDVEYATKVKIMVQQYKG